MNVNMIGRKTALFRQVTAGSFLLLADRAKITELLFSRPSRRYQRHLYAGKGRRFKKPSRKPGRSSSVIRHVPNMNSRGVVIKTELASARNVAYSSLMRSSLPPNAVSVESPPTGLWIRTGTSTAKIINAKNRWRVGILQIGNSRTANMKCSVGITG